MRVKQGQMFVKYVDWHEMNVQYVWNVVDIGMRCVWNVVDIGMRCLWNVVDIGMHSVLNVVDPFEQTASVPLRVPAFGAVVTVALPVATFWVVALVEVQAILPPTPLDAPLTTLT